jgi:hypothetical protein
MTRPVLPLAGAFVLAPLTVLEPCERLAVPIVVPEVLAPERPGIA